MMPQLGSYIWEVLLAYAIAGIILIAIIAFTLMDSTKVKRQLEALRNRSDAGKD